MVSKQKRTKSSGTNSAIRIKCDKLDRWNNVVRLFDAPDVAKYGQRDNGQRASSAVQPSPPPSGNVGIPHN